MSGAHSENLAHPHTRLGNLASALLIAGVFLAGLVLLTRHNDFPAFYHPDEPSKTRQVQNAEYNFNHPLLLLRTSRLFLSGENPAEAGQRKIVRAGRTASAVFSAAAAALLVLAAIRLAGLGAGALVGLLALTNHQIYELAHYMKEDPALLLGVVAAATAFVGVVRPGTVGRPGKPERSGWGEILRMAILGGACGLAVSGKYIGVLTVAFGVLAVGAAPRGRRLSGALAFLTGFALVALTINEPMLESLSAFSASLHREVDYAVAGHKGLTRPVPHGVYGAVFRQSTNPAIWLLIALFYAALLSDGLCRRWWPRMALCRMVMPGDLRHWGLAIFPLLYTVVLSFSPKTHHRYFLPMTALFLLQAGLAPFLLRSKTLRRAALLVAALAIALGAWKTAQYDLAFGKDTRSRLAEFIRNTLPPDAVIVQDKRVGLPVAGEPRFEGYPTVIPQRVQGRLFAADEGSPASLRQRGIFYVAVAEGDYGRFFLKTHQARPEEAAEYERRRAFYEEVFTRGELLWEAPAGLLQYLQPAIRLYRLPPPPQEGPGQ